MANVIGVIVYINSGDGCILGKYQENGLIPRTESLTRTSPAIADPWEGDYDAAWIEGGSKEVGTVEIRKAINPNVSGYVLKWKNEDRVDVFYGHGMLDTHQQMIVCYWDEDSFFFSPILSTARVTLK